MGIRAVIFDVGTVLVHEEPVECLIERWHRRSGLDHSRLEGAVQAIDPQASALGTLREDDVAAVLVERFELDEDDVAAWMSDLWDWYCGSENELVRRYARALRPQHATAILTNSVDGARREENRRFAFEDDFDVLVYSHEVGMAKPDPRLFGHVLDRLAVAPEEALFIDDRTENVESARALGIRAVHYVDSVSALAAMDRLLDRG